MLLGKQWTWTTTARYAALYIITSRKPQPQPSLLIGLKVTFDEFKKWAITQPEIYANIASEIGAGYSDAHAPVLPFPVTPEPERRSDSNSDEVSSEQSGNSK